MSRVLCVWELGGYLGHLTRLLPLALKLRDQGHEVVFVIRDLSRSELILGQYNFKTFQAPVWLLQARGLPEPPESYAEILMQFGYLDKNGLLGMVNGWRNTFELIKPDLVLFDYAPTALIAARDLKVPRAIIGGGFFTPPEISPSPPLRPWVNITDKRLKISEQKIVKVINEVLGSLKLSPITYLYELFQVEENFLTTVPELDHYPDRTHATYWGPVQDDQSGVEPVWAEHSGKKIFAYLKPEYEGLDRVLQAMKEIGANILMFSPNLPDKYIKKYQCSTFQFSRQPFKMSKMISDCDVALCHAGDMLTRILLGGKPQLLFPMQIEQYVTAMRAQELGAALICESNESSEEIKIKFKKILNTAQFQKQAQEFSDKYRIYQKLPPVESIATGCNKLLKLQN